MGLMKKSPAWRSAVAVQIALISAIAAAVFMGIYGIVSWRILRDVGDQ